MTEAVGGRYNLLRLGEGTALNILDVVHDHAAAQVSHVVVLLEALLGRALAIGEKAVVDRALLELYHRRGVRIDRFRPEEMPKLEDLAHALKGEAPSLVKDLERFVSGSLAGVFNAHTTLSLDLDRRYPIVTFDLSDLEGEFQPAFIFALLSSVERVIRLYMATMRICATGTRDGISARASSSREPAPTTCSVGIFSWKNRSELSASGQDWISSKNRSVSPAMMGVEK